MLLPSTEFAQLADQFDICLSGKTAPKGCDIRYRQMYWVMVFDSKGELITACQLAKRLPKYTKSGDSLPEAFAAIVEEGLHATPSLEQLERNYYESRGAEVAYQALRNKMDSLDGVGQMRLAHFLESVASKMRDPNLSRVRSLLVESHACSHQVINHAALTKLRGRIENFLETSPGHTSCGDVIEELLNVGLKYSFDVTVKCQAYAGNWGRYDTTRVKHRELGKLLLKRCAEVLANEKKKFLGMKPKAYGRLRLQARLGDAQATLSDLVTTKTFGVMRPIHAEWRKDAQWKLDQTSPDRK